ncbi:MAG: choice-of-anchor Q domain-containing protein, partial [bacterium]
FNATNGENLVASGKVTTNNVPAGLTAVVARTGAQTATVSLTGKASPHNAANNAANLTIAFVDAAFSNGVAAVVTNATRSNLKVNFLNPNLAYSGTAFNESPTSPGVIPNTLTVTLAGDTFSTVSQDLVGAGKTTVGNVPTGLQAVITTLSTTQATFSLTGVANPNEAANSTNLVVTFLGTAFTGGNAAIVTNATVNNVAVNFVSPKDWYVATNGTDSAPGDGSQAHPYATVQKAVDMAQSAANDVIHLLPGTYTQSGINIGSKLLTIAGDTSADTILQAASTPFTASAGILGGMNAGGYIRNLTFRYGNAGTGFGSAGAVGCAGDVYFDNCVFATNACGAEGGAVWANTTATLTFRNCLFAGNRAGGGGGAVYVWSANLAVSNCTFLANTAATFGGALFRDHEGAIANVAVYDSLFSGNAATNSGGAIYGAKDSRFAIWNSTLASNRAVTGVGGAIFSRMNDGSVTCQVYNSTIALNTAGGGGGAVYMWTQSDRSVNLYNCTVFANGASTNGGGLYLDVYGGNQRYYNLISSIVASNTAGTAGPDIYANGGGAGTVTNSILGSDANAGNGLTEGNPNAGGSYVGTSGSPINPLLAPLANNGGKWPTCALLPGSPAIDHGLNPLGLLWDERGAGYARAYKTLPDMGAFEYGAHLPVTGLVIYFQ